MTESRRTVDGTGGGHSDLVADVIREAGCCRPTGRRGPGAAGSGSFSQALVDEGFASSLGVARRSPSSTTCRSSTSRSPASTPRPRRRSRCRCSSASCAIPFASDGSTLKVAITDPQDVRGLDELRLATRQSVEFFVAAKNDVLTELRRLSRAAGGDERVVRRRHGRRRGRGRATTSRPTTASRTRRSSGSSTR